MANHALLSASSSHRWLNCPPSARLCEGYDDKGSDFAAEGTDAHALCEFKLRTALGLEAKDPTEDLTWYNSEMEECANGYVAFVMELVEEAKKTCPDPVVLIEQRLDYSKYVEEGFGTGDCVIIADGTLHIVDYKHGRGVLVEADDNPQMKLYALGALELFDCIYDIDTISMTIYQPRRQNISTFEVSSTSGPIRFWPLPQSLPSTETENTTAANGASSARQKPTAVKEPTPTWSLPSSSSGSRLCLQMKRSKKSSVALTS